MKEKLRVRTAIVLRTTTGVSLEEGFRRDLQAARSNLTDQTGADVYDEIVARYR